MKKTNIDIKVIFLVFGDTYLFLYLKFKNKKIIFKYFINKIEKTITKGVHKIKCTHNDGENFISTISAKKIIIIFKKKIAKKLGPSTISWLDNLKPQLHFFFISKKLLKIE